MSDALQQFFKQVGKTDLLTREQEVELSKLIEQGENITNQISFSHVDGSRAYFFDGKDYSFLDIIGSEKSFNQDRIDLIKD